MKHMTEGAAADKETSLTRQTHIPLSKYFVPKAKSVPSPSCPTLKSKGQRTKTHLCPSWPQSNWQHVAQYYWQHWEVPLGNALPVGSPGELDMTNSEEGKHSSPQAWEHKIEGLVNLYRDFPARTGFPDSSIKILIPKKHSPIHYHSQRLLRAPSFSKSLQPQTNKGFCHHLVCDTKLRIALTFSYLGIYITLEIQIQSFKIDDIGKKTVFF